jgi:hypothetical protein
MWDERYPKIAWKARKKRKRDPTENPDSLVKNGFLNPEDGADRLSRNVGK